MEKDPTHLTNVNVKREIFKMRTMGADMAWQGCSDAADFQLEVSS